MLQRFARSKASGKHIWQSLSSSLECSGVCQCSTSSGAAAAEELGDVGLGLERRLKQRINVDIANLSKPPDPRPVYAGVVIERYPICFPAPAPWRVEHKEWNLQWNKWKFRQVTDEQMSADKQNIDDSSAEATFQPESIATEADRDNDIRSLRRSTQGFLYLSCRYGFGDDSRWEIPKTLVRDGESLRHAAQRCLWEIAGDSVETFIFANSPSGHIDTKDARTFYMLGVVLDGDIALASDSPASDYAWLQRKELAEAYKQDKHMSRIVHGLLEE